MMVSGRKAKVLYGAVAAAGLALGALPLRAEAADPAGYIGAGLGMVNIPAADNPPVEGTDTSLVAGSIYGGVRLNEVIAIEVGYMKSAKGDIKIENVSVAGLNYDVDAFYGAVVARIPTDGALTPFAKLGMHRYEIGIAAMSGEVRNIDGTELLLGGGVDWALDESWSLRAEYMHLPYSVHLPRFNYDGKVHTFLVGVHRSF